MIDKLLSRRYAQAFFNLFGHALSQKNRDALQEFSSYIKEHKAAFSYVKIALIDDETKVKIVSKLAQKYDLNALLEPLLYVLAKSKRLEILPLVSDQLIVLYNQYHNLSVFTIETSSVLNENQATLITAYLEKKIKSTIQPIFRVNKELIAGMRAISDTYLWEDSVLKKLKNISTITRKG